MDATGSVKSKAAAANTEVPAKTLPPITLPAVKDLMECWEWTEPENAPPIEILLIVEDESTSAANAPRIFMERRPGAVKRSGVASLSIHPAALNEPINEPELNEASVIVPSVMMRGLGDEPMTIDAPV